MPKKITAWECEHGCKKYLKTKKSIVDHEAYCYYNPLNRACAGCSKKIKGTKTVYDPNHGGDPGSTDYEINTMYCDVTGADLFDIKNLKYNCNHWKK